jgi:hypothetical protein
MLLSSLFTALFLRISFVYVNRNRLSEGAQIKEIFRTKQKNVYITLVSTESITFLCSTANATEAKDHGELDQHNVPSP